VLARRTRTAIEVRDRGLAAAPHAAALMAPALGWDEARTAREIAWYRAAVVADLAAQSEPDDLSAFKAASAAPDRPPAPARERPEAR
jgi:glycerol-3-phosphate dehydrogenase